MPATIATIVEGHGEVESVPILLRKLVPGVNVPRPIRVAKSALVRRAGEFERVLGLAAANAAPEGSILVLLDADTDCPATLGPELLQRARDLRPDLSIGLVLAQCEFEAWFIAAAESLRDRQRLRADVEFPASPESIRDAKRWIRENAPRNRYAETVDQPALTALFDVEMARTNSGSFDKFCREVERLVAASS